jgi:hypothetical protein
MKENSKTYRGLRLLFATRKQFISVQKLVKKSIKFNQLIKTSRINKKPFRHFFFFIKFFIFIRFEMLKVTKLPSTNVIKYIYGSLMYKNIFNLYRNNIYRFFLRIVFPSDIRNPFTLLSSCFFYR